MRRRDFVRLVASTAASPFAARAQPAARLPRIGILLFAKDDLAVFNPMLRGLEALGYADGRTVTIEYRDAGADYERLSLAADELVRLNPDVIFSFGGEQAPILKRATSTIPIVVVVSNDPVASGLVESLARPGGNVTGLTYIKGARPADLPMQQPATFQLVISLKSAKTLGLTVPATLLARADEVIE